MVIARLIADMLNWEIHLKQMANGLLAVEDLDVGFDVVRTPDGGSELLELQFGSIEPAIVFNAIKHHFGACDCVVSSGGFQMPRVFISDMDSTMIGQECIDELADYAGLKDHIAAITERAMQGELDFEDALRERVALLEGLPESDITRCLEERIRPNPGARVLVQTLKARGCETVLVTGGFHHFADVVGEQIGFDRVVGNRLEVAGGKLTGKLEGPIVDSQAKRRVLEERVALAGEGAISVAIGDGANDIPMIEAATYGVAYCAKPAARAAADGRIESGDLSALLSLLGVPKSDFIAD